MSKQTSKQGQGANKQSNNQNAKQANSANKQIANGTVEAEQFCD